MEDKKLNKNHDIFAPALAQVDALADIIEGKLSHEEKKSALHRLVEEKIINTATREAGVYLGCLILAYCEALIKKSDVPENLRGALSDFICGNYMVKGVNNCGHTKLHSLNDSIERIQRLKESQYKEREKDRYDFGESFEERQLYYEPLPPLMTVFTISTANYLALWKICETELEKQWGDKDLAKRLAASSALFFKKSENGQLNEMECFVNHLKEHQCNPFVNASILEFAAGCARLTPKREAIISLFKRYQDYTPIDDVVAFKTNVKYVSAEKPGPFFTGAIYSGEKDKFDYLLACNVFCRGAAYTQENRYNPVEDSLFSDLLPHFSNCLKNNGDLIISNTIHDGREVSGIHKIGSRKWWFGRNDGFVAQGPTEKLWGFEQEDSCVPGLTVLKRSFELTSPKMGTWERMVEDRSSRSWDIDM